MSQDWDEAEALRASIHEHMAEIHRLRAAGRQALEALDLAQALSERSAHHAKILDAYEALRAALTEHRSADTGKTSDAPETNFGDMSQVFDSTEDDHIPDAGEMVATINETETVEPVAYITGYFDGKCVIRPLEHVVLPTGMALYLSPPTSQESRQVEPVAWMRSDRGHVCFHKHPEEGDKLSTPLPILAVHVGYRYQSPVGGWEYGDHIPAGFDTDKWAHQKIYIIQDQS